jgi:two-component system response regulator AtoC
MFGAPVAAPDPLATLVGESRAMAALRATLRKVAPHRATVLVTGGSGTGKEVVAHALHALSPRAGAAFVAINCGAIPPGLIESELFGHTKGAFTDAVRDRVGLVEQAAGGTLFLDEIGDLPAPSQVKLLRVLQDGRVRRLGADADLEVDVRVIAATSLALAAEVAAGRFREDLLYRLDVLTLDLPPLRARAGDVPILARHFLAMAREAHGASVTARTIGDDALTLLEAYDWPGNVRELKHAIERAAVLCEGDVIDSASLTGAVARARPAAGPTAVDADADDLSIKRGARRLEESLIRRALARTNGNRTRAAELLEISHRALLYKIKEYGI